MPTTNDKFLKLINKEKSQFDNEFIRIVPGYMFNQLRTVQRNYRYYNSQYMQGNIDNEGDPKLFFNIVKSPCRTTTKAIDFDTKHISIQTAGGGNPLRTWYFERDLKFWMKDQRFGKVLNRIFEELPKFGSVVLKVIKGVPHFVDLRNFIVRQDSDTLDNANYIIEMHLYSPQTFKKVAKELNWNNVDEVLEEYKKMQKPYIRVYERYGEIDGVYTRVYYADVGVDTLEIVTGDTVPYDGIELGMSEVSRHPYYEFHLEKMAGRWLGISVIEILYDNQVKLNIDSNLQSKTAYWMSMVLFQTADTNVSSNLMTDKVSGDVLNTDSPITQVPIDARNLAFFSQAMEQWLSNRDEITFAHDVIKGERLPAGTPLGSARLATAMAGGYFDQMMENIAEDIKDFLYKVIIPDFQRKNTQEHTLRLVGEDLDTYNNLLITERVNKKLVSFLHRKNKLPNKIQFEAIKAATAEAVKKGKERLVKIPNNFYDNIKYKIDIIITGEQKDTATQAQTMFAALQALTTDPTILQDPSKRKFFFKWLEAGGIRAADFISTEAPSLDQMLSQQPVKRGGGGVSRPAAPTPAEPRAAERVV